ncbi:VOC family protein [Solwaraspora sp. WMMD1047]|uniref:VOC family protein n=1 Tax=Solwaraspora sp. WMMD1047 TaxID=3016102 RepID=UPI002416D919|nr:VOC family protein [Solwaraspora sp. WMMD1047]MDG4832751.1 VOC family protein [Solwaraspora sp. WMMD1047]
MADGTRRQVAPVRKLVAAVLGTVATFIVLFGAGMSSWTIVALGVALLVLSVALVLVTSVRSGARAWVTGIGHVHSVSEPPASSTFGRCELQIVIDAPGLPPRSIKVRDPRVPVAKWPDPGATLPIMVAIDDQRHVRILWDEVMTHAEAAARGGLPPEFDDYDPAADDLLIEEDAPPWEQRTPDEDYLGPTAGERMAADLPAEGGRRYEEPVVVRQTPGGTLVLEGTVVEPSPATPLPRRAKPSPGPSVTRPSPAPAAAHSGPAATVAQPGPGPTIAQPDPGPSGSESDRDPDAAMPDVATPAATGSTGPVASASAPPLDEIDIDIDGPPAAYSPRSGSAPSSADPTGPSPYVTDSYQSTGDIPPPGPGGPDPVGGEPVGDAADDDPILAGLPDAPPGGAAGDTGRPIHGVGITLLVADLDRSVAFYRDMLGFLEIDGGEGNAVLASGATRIVLRAIRDVAPINRRLVHLNLDVDDVEAAHAELKAKGVRFTYAPRAVNRGAKLELWAAAFRDPDGHGIALTQWRDRQPR